MALPRDRIEECIADFEKPAATAIAKLSLTFAMRSSAKVDCEETRPRTAMNRRDRRCAEAQRRRMDSTSMIHNNKNIRIVTDLSGNQPEERLALDGILKEDAEMIPRWRRNHQASRTMRRPVRRWMYHQAKARPRNSWSIQEGRGDTSSADHFATQPITAACH
jgi:hypothetical protein